MSPKAKTILNIDSEVSLKKLKNISLIKLGVFIFGVLYILWLIISFFVSMNSWKAVFMDNNQVFFGKYINIPFSSNITLHKTHYLKQSASSSVDSIDIVSIKDNIHNPEDFIEISRNHILYSEQLKSGSIMVQALDREEAKVK